MNTKKSILKVMVVIFSAILALSLTSCLEDSSTGTSTKNTNPFSTTVATTESPEQKKAREAKEVAERNKNAAKDTIDNFLTSDYGKRWIPGRNYRMKDVKVVDNGKYYDVYFEQIMVGADPQPMVARMILDEKNEKGEATAWRVEDFYVIYTGKRFKNDPMKGDWLKYVMAFK